MSNLTAKEVALAAGLEPSIESAESSAPNSAPGTVLLARFLEVLRKESLRLARDGVRPRFTAPDGAVCSIDASTTAELRSIDGW